MRTEMEKIPTARKGQVLCLPFFIWEKKTMLKVTSVIILKKKIQAHETSVLW